MKNDKIKSILEELYQIDGGLKQYEAELAQTIERLVAERPEVEISEEFKAILRQEILAKVEELKQQAGKKNWLESLFVSRPGYGFLGALLLVVLAGGIFYLIGNKDFALTEFGSRVSVSRVGEKAFGSLNSQAPGEANRAAGTGGGGVSSQGARDTAIGGGGGTGAAMPPIERILFKYVYQGEPLELSDQVEVLRREIDSSFRSSLNGLFSKLGMGVINLSSFGGLETQQVSFAQKNSPGYGVYVNFMDGLISIYENYPRVYSAENEQRKVADLPGDEAFVLAAEQFIRQYGIDLSGYGAPEVNQEWLFYAMADMPKDIAKESISAPSVVSVIYPLEINGQQVFDGGGTKYGITANINVSDMRVSALYNLGAHTYQSSLYDGETNLDKLLDNIGQRYAGYWPDSETSNETITVELGTPEGGYLNYQNWLPESNKADSLLVPALRFPVLTSLEAGYYIPKNIVVPLARDLTMW